MTRKVSAEFVFVHTPTPEHYSLSLHDALPISSRRLLRGNSPCSTTRRASAPGRRSRPARRARRRPRLRGWSSGTGGESAALLDLLLELAWRSVPTDANGGEYNAGARGQQGSGRCVSTGAGRRRG